MKKIKKLGLKRKDDSSIKTDNNFLGKKEISEKEIGGVSSEESAWSKKADDTDGTQIDLIIERKDNIVNMCEIKFYSNDFSVDKDYHKVLMNREELLARELSPKMMIHKTLITTVGLKYNEYSSDFDNVIILDDLFK